MRIGGTIGVFDLIHVGHLRFLKNCKSQCDYLKVGIGSDRIVAIAKNKQPVINQLQRQEMVDGVRYTDESCLFDVGLDNTAPALEWIKNWQINCFFVSDDWAGSARWARLSPLLLASGIEVIWVPYTPDISSSMIKQRIANPAP